MGKIGIIYLLRYLAEFTFEAIWTWCFLFGKVLTGHLILFVGKRLLRSFFLVSALTACVYQEISLFHLSCQIWGHRVDCNIPLLSFSICDVIFNLSFLISIISVICIIRGLSALFFAKKQLCVLFIFSRFFCSQFQQFLLFSLIFPAFCL